MTSGSGTFNCDARRLAGFQQFIPEELTDPEMTFFKDLQDHFGLCRFGKRNDLRYCDFLDPGIPLLNFTFKDLQGPSGQITPKTNHLSQKITAKNARGLFTMKSDLDIVGNVADVMCVTKNKVNGKISRVFC